MYNILTYIWYTTHGYTYSSVKLTNYTCKIFSKLCQIHCNTNMCGYERFKKILSYVRYFSKYVRKRLIMKNGFLFLFMLILKILQEKLHVPVILSYIQNYPFRTTEKNPPFFLHLTCAWILILTWIISVHEVDLFFFIIFVF